MMDYTWRLMIPGKVCFSKVSQFKSPFVSVSCLKHFFLNALRTFIRTSFLVNNECCNIRMLLPMTAASSLMELCLRVGVSRHTLSH